MTPGSKDAALQSHQPLIPGLQPPRTASRVERELQYCDYWDHSTSYPSFMMSKLRPMIVYNPSHWNNEHGNAHAFTLYMKFSTAIECGIIYAYDLVRDMNILDYVNHSFMEHASSFTRSATIGVPDPKRVQVV
jgi:hypothetical protein